jgi:hypothetical protein
LHQQHASRITRNKAKLARIFTLLRIFFDAPPLDSVVVAEGSMVVEGCIVIVALGSRSSDVPLLHITDGL